MFPPSYDPKLDVVGTPTTDPRVPTVHVAEGAVVTADPKSPLFSSTVWGIAVTLTFGVLSRQKWWTFDQGTTAKAMEEIMSLVVGPMMSLHGRWTATRPLGMRTAQRKTYVVR